MIICFDMQIMELKHFIEPLFKKILDYVSPETVDDWAACVSNISVSMLTTVCMFMSNIRSTRVEECIN